MSLLLKIQKAEKRRKPTIALCINPSNSGCYNQQQILLLTVPPKTSPKQNRLLHGAPELHIDVR